MRSANFDVQLAMRHVYDELTKIGYRPRIEIAPAEWEEPGGAYVRFAHVAGCLEVWFRPHGKKVTNSERHWRLDKSRFGYVGFVAELDGIVAAANRIPIAATKL